MPYVSIDIETTGLDPERSQVIEIGAVIDDGMNHLEECPTFHCYLEQGYVVGEPYAVSMHPTIFRRIATKEEGFTYLPSWQVAGEFQKWLQKHGLNPADEKIVVAGKNYAKFDARHLSKLTKWDEYIQVHHRILDPAPLYWRPEIDGFLLPDTNTCMERAGIAGDVSHTAVEDARMVALLIRRAIAGRRLLKTNLGQVTLQIDGGPNVLDAMAEALGDRLCGVEVQS
ncbi:MAG: 3'-5' exonuclease [Planctomycetota bacterium]|nr:MAG: 3'-5' exonuclease [Planctomycetota bacterium]REJ92002.1 MAG: 3'-5' exonuclease [Planctomycetota bacterium]REK28538.1 MAG: 3'-5' exonuclease [Planctomycetota bacterium]REK39153.1 MAG: 3'-5' exonuclease [Planctomycetota bacterium]